MSNYRFYKPSTEASSRQESFAFGDMADNGISVTWKEMEQAVGTDLCEAAAKRYGFVWPNQNCFMGQLGDDGVFYTSMNGVEYVFMMNSRTESLEEDIAADQNLVQIEEEPVGDSIAYTVYYDNRPAGHAMLRRIGDDWLSINGDIHPEFSSLGLDLLLLRKAEAIAMDEDRAIKKTVH